MTKQKLTWIAAGVVILIAAVLRLYRFEGFVTFLGDQGRDALIVKRIVTFEHFPAIGAPSSVGQVYLGPFYYYLISPFLPLFGFHPVGLAYAVAFMWIGGIVWIWYVMNKKYSAIFALLLTVLITFSLPLIELSRFSWNPNLLPLFSFATFYFFYRWFKDQSWWYALLFGSFLSFAIQLHYLAFLIFPTLGISYLYYVLPTFKPKKLLHQSLISLGGFLFFSIPLVLFDLKHNFLNSKNFIALFTEGKVSSESSYISRLQETVQALMQHITLIDLSRDIAMMLFVFILIISFVALYRIRSRLLIMHFVNVLLFVLGFAALDSARHMHYFGPSFLSLLGIIASWVYLVKMNIYKFVIAALVTIPFLYLNIPKYPYFTQPSNSQINSARQMANSFKPYIKNQPIQIVTIPFTETHGHFRYFLEIDGYKVLSEESPEQGEELYVLCFQECQPIGDAQWQIAAFSNKKIETSWEKNGVTIYKIVHGTE